MKKIGTVDAKAGEFAQRAAAIVKESGGFGGEYYCDAQRELWLDIARRGYQKAVEEGRRVSEPEAKPEP